MQLSSCRICGLPEVAGGLCWHDAGQAFAGVRRLLAAIDTRDDLTEEDTRRDWVLTMQLLATEVARYVPIQEAPDDNDHEHRDPEPAGSATR